MARLIWAEGRTPDMGVRPFLVWCGFSAECVVEYVPCERIIVVLAAGVVVVGEGGECVADAYERGDFCVLDRFLDRVYGSLLGDVCCDVVEALCCGFEVE